MRPKKELSPNEQAERVRKAEAKRLRKQAKRAKDPRVGAANLRAALRVQAETLDVLDLAHAAAYLDCDERLVARALRSGGLVGAKPSNAAGWRVTKDRLRAWVDAGMPGAEPAGSEAAS